MKQGTIKKFREYLNIKLKDFPNWKHNQFRQLKRGYGDYLYFQDRVRFDVLLNETLQGHNPEYQDFLDSI